MNFSSINLKRRTDELIGFFQSHYFLSAILIVGIVLVCVVEIQKYLDRRDIESQTIQIQKYETDKKLSQEQTQKLLEMFSNQHEQTLSILDAIKNIDGSITILAENDRLQDEKVNNLGKEYQNARQPNVQNQSNNPVHRARINSPLRQRETDVLSTDAELYPNASR